MTRPRRAGRTGSIGLLLAGAAAIAIAGTLVACGRYGPPQRRPRPPEASTVGVDEPAGPSSDEGSGEERDPERDEERDEQRDDRAQ